MGDCMQKRSLSINKASVPMGRAQLLTHDELPTRNCHILQTWFSDSLNWDRQTTNVRDKLTV